MKEKNFKRRLIRLKLMQLRLKLRLHLKKPKLNMMLRWKDLGKKQNRIESIEKELMLKLERKKLRLPLLPKLRLQKLKKKREKLET